MDLIRCPICGEEYSSSYPRCPFCEEDDTPRRAKRAPKRRIANKQKAQSARGGLIIVLVLVLALLGWYLFGDSIIHRGETTTDDTPQTTTDTTPKDDEPSVPASNPNTQPAIPGSSNGETDPQTGGESGETATPEPTTDPEPATPPVTSGADVSNATLNRSDFTLSYAGEKFTIKVSGTNAEPTWSSDNPNVATISADGTVRAVANGDTTVHCKVGDRDLTCTVRVRGTGQTAARADAPMTATPVTPEAPAAPGSTTTTTPSTSGTTTPPSTSTTTPSTSTGTPVDASLLRIKTNLTGVLPKDGSKYDCTVSLGGDVIRLIVIDDSGKEVKVSWSSGNTDIAEIAEDGTVKPISRSSAGTTMTATVGEAKIACIIRVR